MWLLWDKHGNSRPRKRGGGGFQQTKSGEGEGEGWETYITMKICHWLYTIGCLEMGGEGGRVLTHWAGPQRGMATSSVSGQALAPWPWPLTPRVGGEGGRDRGAAAHVGVQCPTSQGQLHQDHQPAGPGTRGDRDGVPTFCPPPLSGSGDRGQQVSHPCRVRAAVTFCCVECPGTSCWCTAGGSLFW